MSDTRKRRALHAALTVLAESDVDAYAAQRRAEALVQALEGSPSNLDRWRVVRAELDLTPHQAARWLEQCGYMPARSATATDGPRCPSGKGRRTDG